MKRIFAVLLFVLFGMTNVAFASKIPDNELNFLKTTFKDLNVRFDGLIELKDGTTYIPVYPVEQKNINNLKITQTIPAGKSLADKPDFLMFNSNFSFFKLKKDENKSTIVYNENIPDNVKLGLLPQDLLVPQGFQLPSELRIIMGDLLIPIAPAKEYKEVNVVTGKVVENSPRTTVSVVNIEQLSDKYFYATSFNSNAVSILNANTGKPFKKIEFTSIPSNIKLTNNGKYLLVSTWKHGKVFVIDAQKTQVLKDIPVGEKPSSIAVLDGVNIAYVANSSAETISRIDVANMQLIDNIKVIGKPTYLVLDKKPENLYYLDAISGKVYYMEKLTEALEPYSIKPLFKANNLKKIQYYDEKIYTLDRGKNELLTYYINGKGNLHNNIDASDIKLVNTTTENIAELKDINSDKKQKTKKQKEKVPFKQKVKKGLKALLYYREDNSEIANIPVNPNNQVQVIAQNSLPIAETTENKNNNKKSFKQRFKEYMKYDYKQEKDIELQIEKERMLKLNNQMDFFAIPNKASDFLVWNKKLYILCPDDALVLVYNANTNEYLNTIELNKNGYYNSIKVSKDGKLGVITNITSNELTLFDIEKDTIIQKLPLEINVHDVVITGKN